MLKKMFVILSVGVLAVAGLLVPVKLVYATEEGAADTSDTNTAESEDAGGGSGGDVCDTYGKKPPGICDDKGEDELVEVVRHVLNTVYFWLGILAAAFIVIGGVNYTTSQGDPAKVKKAKDTILYAVIGLVVALLAFAITQFVLNALEGK